MDLVGEIKRQAELFGLVIGDDDTGRLGLLLQEMLRWNKTYNLTAITDPVEVVEKHLVDSLTLLPLLDGVNDLLDIGSGAGFPSLPLKIMRPDIGVVSVDSVGKKIGFQKHAARKLRFERFLAWHGRAEEMPTQSFAAGGFDAVVARAFSALPKLVELALPCLRPNGRILAMKGPEGERELSEAAPYLEQSEVECLDRIELALPISKAGRQILVLGRKHKI